MKKRLLTSLAVLTVALAVQAIPAKRGVWKTITLADGSAVRVELCGDEFLHYWRSADGTCYQASADGKVYQQISLEEKMVKVGERREAADRRRAARWQSPSKANYTGTKKCLVILVDFPDKKFQTGHDNAYYQDVVNKENFTSAEGYVGSVHDYFHAQSGGVFDLTFDVAGPYTMPQNSTYYGEDVDYYGEIWKDYHVSEMITAACRAANPDVSYKDYDWDNDGTVDQVYILYAGDNQAALSDDTDLIWPHESQITGYLSLDGKHLSTYATGSEMTGGLVDGIGTFCHEFSHCLGLMDTYDTGYSGGYGMGSWDVMCQGTYNGAGLIPAGYTSYEKMFCGWLEPTVLTGEVDVEGMKALSDGGEAYIIYNQANSNEYYLLENRQKKGWDAALPGSGLLILHVDYNRDAWRNNTINATPSHQRLTIFPADNAASYSNESTDPYPYRNRNSLTNTSIPAATLYNFNSDGTKLMNYPISQISVNGGLVSFIAGRDVPIEDLNGPAVDPTGALLYESFDQCAGYGANDQLWDGSDLGKAELKADVDGWYYRAGGAGGADRCVLFGTTTISGNMATPIFTLNGQATVTFKAAAYADGNCTLTLKANNGTLTETTFPLSKNEWTVCTTKLTGNGEVRLVVTPSQKQFFFDEFVVMPDGESAVVSVNAEPQTPDNRIFTIDGRYVGTDASLLPRGIYVRGGKKLVF